MKKVVAAHLYAPCKVMVVDLDESITKSDIREYFDHYGHVVDVVLKIKPSKKYAFVEFTDQEAAEWAMRLAPHMIRRVPVRLLRVFAAPLPSYPFPGMGSLEASSGVPRTPGQDIAFLPRQLPRWTKWAHVVACGPNSSYGLMCD